MREGLHKIVSSDETIVAISTPLGRSGIGVVRISGHSALPIAQRYLRAGSPIEHRTALLGRWLDDAGDQIDEVVLTFFRAPNSYTGEDIVEISAHGNPVTLKRIVETVRNAGARVAAPGEFTLRAVAHGKMDLIQAEAVREFIEAQTERQARTALRQIEGSLSRRVRPIKDTLVDIIAHLEAGIDFSEDDLDVPASASIVERLRPVRRDLSELQQTFGYGKMLVEGFSLAILGKPNVGKSSLFNRLISSERAIVTEVPGTTRDVLTEVVQMDGIPLRFADTAGVRETVDRVESIGVARAFEVMSDAELALIVLDTSRSLDEDDERVLSRAKQMRHLVVLNKTDLPSQISLAALNGATMIRVSAKTGEGLDELRAAIRGAISERMTDLSDDLVLTSARQNDDIVRAIQALERGESAMLNDVPHEMVLLDLYDALSALNELTGEVVTEDILGRIFSTFCIGK